MTTEEAIYRLNALLTMCEYRDAYGDRVDSEPYEEAVGMAIEALENYDGVADALNDYAELYRKLKEKYDNLKKQNQWIPCSERLPEKDGDYLVCHTVFGKTTAIDIAGYAKNLRKVDKYDFTKNKSGWYQYDSEYGYYETDGIVAWMPLPKAYEGRTK